MCSQVVFGYRCDSTLVNSLVYSDKYVVSSIIRKMLIGLGILLKVVMLIQIQLILLLKRLNFQLKLIVVDWSG